MILLFIFCFSVADLESLYVHEDYVKVIEQAPFVLLDTTLSQTEIVEVNKFYAFSLAIMGRKDGAIRIFHRILDLKPDFMLDPIKISPKIMNVFNEAKTKKVLQMPVPSPLKDTIYIERYIEKKFPVTALIPGIYQVQKKKKFKGYVIIAAEIISLAGLGISQYYYNKSHDDYLAAQDPQDINDKYEIYNSWHKKRLIFISTSTIIWLYNIIDVLYFQ